MKKIRVNYQVTMEIEENIPAYSLAVEVGRNLFGTVLELDSKVAGKIIEVNLSSPDIDIIAGE